MSRPMQPFQFHPRRAPAVVRQSGPGRTTLHLDPEPTTGEAGGAGGSTTGARGRGSRISGLSGTAGRGRGGTAAGLRGRRGRWGGSTRRVPPFLEFWGLASAAETSEANGQRRWRQTQRRPQDSVWFRSPEFLIFVLGLAALLALIVFVTDMLSNRPFKPMAVLVFVTAGTYCVALARQQRSVVAAEQALVIEIIDGSAAEARRTVISKEDRRALFDYFKHRPPRSHREDRAASNAHETSGGGGGEAGSPAPTATAPPCPCSPGVPGAAVAAAATLEGGGEKGVEQLAGGRQVLNVATAGVESEMLAPSSGAAAGFSSGVSVTSGAVEEGGDVGVVGEERLGSCSQAVMPGCHKPEAELAEESKESEVPVRGTARGNSEQWSTAGSCIVCFGEYADGDELCRLPCRHTYHAECIDAWLDGPDHAWCPLCKSSLLPTVPRNSSTASATDATNGSMGNDGIDRVVTHAAGGLASAVIGDEAV